MSNLYIVAGGSIRFVDYTTGLISTIAQASGSIAVDSGGNLFYCTSNAVKRIDAVTRNITTVAGGNSQTFSGDGGPATQAGMSPGYVGVDQSGNLYIAGYGRIRRVDSGTGIITTIAGNGQSSDFSGITGLPTQTTIGYVFSMTVSPQGDVFMGTQRFVLRLSNGSLSVIAGNGGTAYAGDGGPATLAPVLFPVGLAVDQSENVFVSESSCNCVRRIAADSGIIQTVAGTGSAGISTDAIPATQAALNAGAIAINGNVLYIVDGAQTTPARIRAVNPAMPPPMPQPPVITQIVDSIDFEAEFSPGALVTVFGNYLASSAPASAEIGADGRVTTELSETQVLFGGIAGPVLYASAAQINAVVPYALSRGNTSVEVETEAGSSAPDTIFLTDVSPAFFGGFVFNPDGTVNSATNPAPNGATLVLYGTGIGKTNPPGIDGAIVQGPPFPVPLNPFSAYVYNGPISVPATILYLGPMPTAITGAVQANIKIPPSIGGTSSFILTGPTGLGNNFSSLPIPIYIQQSAPPTNIISGTTRRSR